MEVPEEDEEYDGPLLPMDVIMMHIVPRAFDHPSEAVKFPLLCSAFRWCLQKSWFWMAWVDGQRDKLIQMVESRQWEQDEDQVKGLLRSLQGKWDTQSVHKTLLRSRQEKKQEKQQEEEDEKLSFVSFVSSLPWRTMIVKKGLNDRNSSCFIGQATASGVRNGVAAVFYSSGNSFFGTYVNNSFNGPDCTFRWSCGMSFYGNLKSNARFGKGKIFFTCGSEFEGDFVEYSSARASPGRWRLRGSREWVEGWLGVGYGEWFNLPDEQERSPFFRCQVGDNQFYIVTLNDGKLVPYDPKRLMFSNHYFAWVYC